MPSSDQAWRRHIARIVDDRARALATRDDALLRSLLHADFVYTNASGDRFDADGYVALTVGGVLHWQRQETTLRSVLGRSDVAVVTADVLDVVEVSGETHAWHFTTTQVYVADGGHVLYLAGHTGPAAAR